MAARRLAKWMKANRGESTFQFRGGDRVHHPRGDIHPDIRLHPEVPLVAALGLVHLRAAGLALIGRRRGGDDGGIDDRALAHQQPALLQHRAHFVEQRPGQILRLQPIAEIPANPRNAWLS